MGRSSCAAQESRSQLETKVVLILHCGDEKCTRLSGRRALKGLTLDGGKGYGSGEGRSNLCSDYELVG